MTVITMSRNELMRLRVLIDVGDGRLSVEDATGLIGVGRRQIYRLLDAFLRRLRIAVAVDFAPEPHRLEDAVRRGLGLRPSHPYAPERAMRSARLRRDWRFPAIRTTAVLS
jgi:hypothetical protein